MTYFTVHIETITSKEPTLDGSSLNVQSLCPLIVSSKIDETKDEDMLERCQNSSLNYCEIEPKENGNKEITSPDSSKSSSIPADTDCITIGKTQIKICIGDLATHQVIKGFTLPFFHVCNVMY